MTKISLDTFQDNMSGLHKAFADDSSRLQGNIAINIDVFASFLCQYSQEQKDQVAEFV